MANQSPDRREVLAMLGRVAALGSFPGFSKWVCAAEHAHTSAPQNHTRDYQPQFFNPPEYHLLDTLCDLIIPKDETPGARDAGVIEFIDFLVSHDDDLQYPFRTGLGWFNAVATQKHGRPFRDLPAGDQVAMLSQLAYSRQHSPSELEGQQFFLLLRKYTVIGYYTSRIGLEQLNYPGLQLYSSSPECPHRDDPEHTHLPHS